MRTNRLADFTHRSFAIKLQESLNTLTARFEGEMTERDPNTILTPYFGTLADSLEKDQLLVLDFRGISIMNSGSVSPIVRFVELLHHKGIKAQLLYDTTRGWQQISMQCMNIICKKMDGITVIGR